METNRNNNSYQLNMFQVLISSISVTSKWVQVIVEPHGKTTTMVDVDILLGTTNLQEEHSMRILMEV